MVISINQGVGALLPHYVLPGWRWMLADGRELNRLDYPELFAEIQTKYGEGDGEKTFNIPSLNEKSDASYKTDKIVKPRWYIQVE